MDYNDVKLYQNYLFDPANTQNALEISTKVVQAVNKRKPLFSKGIVTVIPYNNYNGNSMILNRFDVGADLLMPMSDNITKNVLIRYPADLPAFSANDVAILGKIGHFAAVNAKEFDLNDDELLMITGLISKVKFYADITEGYRPSALGSDK